MKKRLYKAALIGAMIFVILAAGGCGKEKTKVTDTLTVCNYGEYIDPDVLSQFQEETGIEVKYEEALTPEEMYTKYKSGAVDYELLCTSDYMLERLISEGELLEVDMDALEYKDNIGDKYWELSQSFDPDNKFTVPYFWGTVGILYDTTKVKEPVDSWDVLFNGEYSGDIIMQNSMRDSYMVALKTLGYSLNTTDPEEIKKAQELLLKQKPDVQAYLVDEVRDEVVSGNAAMGVIYSGEAYLGHEYNPDLAYAVPKEGSNVWVDSWCVTRKCHNTEAAQQFLDFLCREDVAMKNFEYIYYSTPNEAVIAALSEEEQNNETLVPDESVMDNCEVYKQLDEDTTSLLNDYWKKLKAD